MKITHIDHLVLTVSDVEASVAFYSRIFGMEPVSFADGRRAVTFGEQKINFHQKGEEIAPHAAYAAPGTADLCLITDTPLEAVSLHLRSSGVYPQTGIVRRTGARGAIRSLYIRDPDGNLLEISTY